MSAQINPQTNLNSSLKKLMQISDWFDQQEEIDVEEGIKRVKQAAELIKASKGRLKEVETEFDEIKRDIESEISG